MFKNHLQHLLSHSKINTAVFNTENEQTAEVNVEIIDDVARFA